MVKDESTIYEIAKRLEDSYPNCGSIDFLAEENVYSPLCYVKKVPPLSYNILTRESVGKQLNVPVEIRICTRESYLSNQSIHDTIYKNDELDIPLEERIRLLCVSQHVVYKLALLYNSRDQKKTLKQELNQILKDNKSIIAKYDEVFLNVIMDYGMNVYEYEHHRELDSMHPNKRMEILHSARNRYHQLYVQLKNEGLDFEQRINMSLCKIRSMNVGIPNEEVQI